MDDNKEMAMIELSVVTSEKLQLLAALWNMSISEVIDELLEHVRISKDEPA